MRTSSLTILHTFAPGPVGGAEQVVADLTAALAIEGHTVHLVPILDEGSSDHPFLSLISPQVEVHPVFLPPRSYLQERRALLTLLDRIQPSVIHTHGYRSDLMGGLAARARSCPIVSTVHGFTGGGWKNRLYERVQQWALRRADRVIAVSDPLSAQLQQVGLSTEQLEVIPNARSLPRGGFLPAEDARSVLGSLPGDSAQGSGVASLGTPFHIGWIGRMSWEKGPDVLLETLSRMSDGPWKATFIGTGSLLEELKVRAREQRIDDRIGWAGVLPEAARYLRAFDVVVLSSRSEGTPIVLLEAMAAGVPVVATRVGGIPDIVTEREAVLVDPEDPGALSRAITMVRDAPEQGSRRARRARERFDEVASTKKWAQRHLGLYWELAKLR